MEELIKVIFACSKDGKHDAPIMNCTEKSEKTFDSYLKAIEFIRTCSYVYNTDEVVNGIPLDIVPDIPLDKLLHASFNY